MWPDGLIWRYFAANLAIAVRALQILPANGNRLGPSVVASEPLCQCFCDSFVMHDALLVVILVFAGARMSRGGHLSLWFVSKKWASSGSGNLPST
jgi:hypothetical protein